MNKILIFKEKHSNRYFDASTVEAHSAACLKILKERLEEGYWYDPGDPPDKEDILSEEQISSLPTEILKRAESERRKRYLRELANYEEEVKFVEDAKDAIANNKGRLAYKLLMWRRDGEYERFYEEELETV